MYMTQRQIKHFLSCRELVVLIDNKEVVRSSSNLFFFI